MTATVPAVACAPSPWTVVNRADPGARALADRHYNRQRIGATQFVPPGRCVVLLSRDQTAFWVTSWPFAAYARHAWAGAWLCSAFRNEGGALSSDLIREAVAVTREIWPDVPGLGLVTFIDPGKTRRKRDPGRCFRKAGFRPAACPAHAWLDLILEDCAACQSRTAGGLVALQLLPDDMPAPATAHIAARQLALPEAV